MFNRNIITAVDSYKLSQYLQVSDNIQYFYSYIESRGGIYDATMVAGIVPVLKEWFVGKVVTQEKIEEAAEIAALHGEPFNREGWEYILKEHDGKLPLAIYAVPEGTVVPTKNVLVGVYNTDPKCYWLVSYIETILLRGIWYPTTVSTQSYECKKVIAEYLKRSTGNLNGLEFSLHSFGCRGVSSDESAMLGDMGHLYNFDGTDTIPGIMGVRKYYGDKMPAFSIPASEHSVSTSWTGIGKIYESTPENDIGNENVYIESMLKQLDNYQMVAMVADTYNVYEFCHKLGKYADYIKEKYPTKRVICRPDSGDPVEVAMKCIEILAKYFGYTTNELGYKVLNNVRIIWGDGVNALSINSVLMKLTMWHWSAENIAFGMGGALLQQVNRDDLKFAMKASCIGVLDQNENLVFSEIFKDPITDKGKTSKKGFQRLVNDGTGYKTVSTLDFEEFKKMKNSIDKLVFYNGYMFIDDTFQDVKNRARREFI